MRSKRLFRLRKDGAADARSAVEKALPAASRFLSRFIYTTSYTFSYGVVFPAVLIAKSIPSEQRARARIGRRSAGRERHGRPVEKQSRRLVAGRSGPVASLLN